MSRQLNCGCTVSHEETIISIRMRSTEVCINDGVVPAVDHLTICNGCYE